MVEQKIDLNAATAQELAELPGIGRVLAERIVTYRSEVQAFRESADIVAVSGIGERTHRAIADRLTVIPPSEAPYSAPEGDTVRTEEDESLRPSEIEHVLPKGEEEGLSQNEIAAVGKETEATAIPPDEPVPEEAPARLEMDELDVEDAEIGTEEPSAEVADQAVSMAGPHASEEPGLEAENEGSERSVAQEKPEAPSAEPAAQVVPSGWPRGLSWLWTAMLGGLLGMLFSLVVFAGINGSLDVGHSRVVLGIQREMDGLSGELDSLGSDLARLERRLEALEGLTSRLEDVEAAVDELGDETSALRDQVGALGEEVLALSKELEGISEKVAALQLQAEETRSFFGGLQTLLQDVFGDVGGAPVPTPPAEEK